MGSEGKEPQELPTLARLGTEFARLEAAAGGSDRPIRPRAVLAAVVAVAAVGISTGLLAFGGAGPARASSAVNRAPAYAEQTGAVRFISAITVTVNRQLLRHFVEYGELDFADHRYSMALRDARGRLISELRSVDGTLYARGSPGGRAGRWGAIALPRRSDALITAPELDAFADPLYLLGQLRDVRTPAVYVGRVVLGGERVYQYRIATDLASLLRAGASASGGAIPPSYSSVTARLTVWLDRHGRPARVRESFGASFAGPYDELVTDTTFTRYGEPLTVVPPTHAEAPSGSRAGLPSLLAAGPTSFYQRLLFAPGSFGAATGAR
jgi:hypothetical protein